MIEAKIQAVIIIMTIFCDIPEMTVSEKAVRSFAKISPMAMANSNTGQNPRSSGAPDKAMYTTPERNIMKGAKAPNVPP